MTMVMVVNRAASSFLQSMLGRERKSAESDAARPILATSPQYHNETAITTENALGSEDHSHISRAITLIGL